MLVLREGGCAMVVQQRKKFILGLIGTVVTVSFFQNCSGGGAGGDDGLASSTSQSAAYRYCYATAAGGRTQFNLEENISIVWASSQHFKEIGQRNRVFNFSGTLIGQNPTPVSWGQSPGSNVFSAIGLSRDLTPLLLTTERVRVDYEILGLENGVWQSCGVTQSLTWSRPPESVGGCVIPEGYSTSCGGPNVKVFRGGVCLVSTSPVASAVGRLTLCNSALQWEFVPDP
jgi:hypothetical protein